MCVRENWNAESRKEMCSVGMAETDAVMRSPDQNASDKYHKTI